MYPKETASSLRRLQSDKLGSSSPQTLLLPRPPVLRGERAGVRGEVISRENGWFRKGYSPPHPRPSPPEYRGRGEQAASTRRGEDIQMAESPQLLVSVRSPEEAEEAIAGGADLIDVKEPDRGSLGRADDSAVRAIREQVVGRRPVSAAMGELVDFAGSPPVGCAFLKWGLAGIGSDWRDRLDAAHAQCGDADPVTVGYADWQCAGAPDIDEVIAHACARRGSILLIDTHCKDANFQGRRPTLLDWLPLPWLTAILDRCRRSEVRVALAGCLGYAEIEAVRLLRPDWIAVRGLACAGESRTRIVSRERVRNIRAAIVGRL